MSARVLIAGVIVGTTLVGVAIGRYPWLKMNRATIALVGATLLVALGVHLSFREYLKAGTPIAILSLLIGVAWLSW